VTLPSIFFELPVRLSRRRTDKDSIRNVRLVVHPSDSVNAKEEPF
jgi:hypothetical protein